MPASPASPVTSGTIVDPTRAAMRALVARRYGPPDALELAIEARPAPAPDEVLVRVAAAGLSRAAMHLLTGTPYLLRLAGFGLRAPKQPVVGNEVAGVVAAVGSDVTGFAQGDEVFGYASGACAELAVSKAAKLAHKPAELTFAEAAATVDSASTALQAVRDHAAVQPGQRVLVLGASGGVGSFVVQLAADAGAEVTGTARTAKVDFVRSLGAAHVVDHSEADPLAVDRPFDVIIDIGGNHPVRRLRKALAADGTLVIVGGEGGGPVTGGFQRQLLAPLRAMGSSQTVKTFVASENAETLDALAALATAGRLRPAIDRIHPLADGADAFRRMAAGEIRGKDVIEVAAPGQ
jgi:NADPH:quinone reductase-like Zn-dependent oxidoreductase